MSKKMLPLNAVVGAKVRARRLVLGMSQRALAAAIGVEYQQVQKYENGTNRMDVARLAMIGRALNVPAEWFFAGLEPAEDDAARAGGNFYGRELLTLVRAWRRLAHPTTKGALLELIEAVADQDEAERLSSH